MTNSTHGVDIQGMRNTIDLKTVMNLYTSSFTEGFISVLENYNTPLEQFVTVTKEVKPTKVVKQKSNLINLGFEKEPITKR